MNRNTWHESLSLSDFARDVEAFAAELKARAAAVCAANHAPAPTLTVSSMLLALGWARDKWEDGASYATDRRTGALRISDRWPCAEGWDRRPGKYRVADIAITFEYFADAVHAAYRHHAPAPTAPRETAPPVGNPAAGPRDDVSEETVVAGGWVSALSSSARSTYINAKIIAANPIAAVDLGSVTVGSHEATVRVPLLEELARRTILLAQEAGKQALRAAIAEEWYAGTNDELRLICDAVRGPDTDAFELHRDVEALVAERDELAATLANERGEGTPPAPGWRNDTGEALWWRVLAGHEDDPDDALYVYAYDLADHAAMWERFRRDQDGRISSAASGRATTVRGAMLAADAATATPGEDPAPRGVGAPDATKGGALGVGVALTNCDSCRHDYRSDEGERACGRLAWEPDEPVAAWLRTEAATGCPGYSPRATVADEDDGEIDASGARVSR